MVACKAQGYDADVLLGANPVHMGTFAVHTAAAAACMDTFAVDKGAAPVHKAAFPVYTGTPPAAKED